MVSCIENPKESTKTTRNKQSNFLKSEDKILVYKNQLYFCILNFKLFEI